MPQIYLLVTYNVCVYACSSLSFRFTIRALISFVWDCESFIESDHRLVKILFRQFMIILYVIVFKPILCSVTSDRVIFVFVFFIYGLYIIEGFL